MTAHSVFLNQVVTLLASLLILFPASPDSCGQRKHLAFEKYLTTEIYSSAPHVAILAPVFDRKYRTVIREGLANGVNFAGHYVVVEWGCGTGCSSFVVVDAKTGIIYDPPTVVLPRAE